MSRLSIGRILIGMEETPEEKAMRLDFIEWAKNQPWNLEEQDQCSRADSV